MTWLRGVLADIADDSPHVDLADEAIRIYERRRRTGAALIAAATVAVIVLGATATVRLLPGGSEKDQVSTPGRVENLPAKGVGPLSHAYRTFCNPITGKAPGDCRVGAWRVVTTAGQTYHLDQALPAINYHDGVSGIGDSKVAISADGGKIAYYAPKVGTFQVRDLASGQLTTAPVKIPRAWLGSIMSLLLSADGRFLAFTKNPALDDPAMLLDMREGMVRPLPNGWTPVGLTADGDTMTMVDYSPKARLQTMTRLWKTATAGNSSTVSLPKNYRFSPLAPGGTMIAAMENRVTQSDSCVPTPLVQMDAKTGRILRKVEVRGLPMDTHNISLRTWLSPTEVTALAEPNQFCRTGKPSVPDGPNPRPDPPYETVTSYALNVQTGQARKLPATYRVQELFGLVLPGAPGAL
ncbi:hypothetical protein [Acrocarpospora sp. B8E8]|uniref:hypothetical protein n=1 Tax=Acrocarpospora sp. B8E8 TaxID=3153572 RepID=UPI00325EDE58